MKKAFAFFAGLLLYIPVSGQQYRPLPAAEIYQKLQQLNVLGTVMYVAAHPDDENTRLLSYLVHHDHVRTIYLSLTRGDGGQNILGNEQGSTLGLIRNYELMEARKIDGAEQLFTKVIDFGYTKSPEETFRFWNKQDLTEEVLETFRKYKPDVIICRFPTTGEGGHGQHTVSAIIAEEAFTQSYKEAKSTGVWQPKRILFNSFRFGDRNTTSEDQFKITINQYDPLLGEGYGEMAGRSRSVHKSQGAGTPQTVGVTTEYFKFLQGEAPIHSLYEGIDLSWNRVQHPEIGEHIKTVINSFDFTDPAAIVPELVQIRKEIRTSLTDDFWKTQKLKEIDQIILSCAGIMAELVTDKPEATRGSEVTFTLNIVARDKNAAVLEKVNWPTMKVHSDVGRTVMAPDSLYKFQAKLGINNEALFTEPYWLGQRASLSNYNYDSHYEGLPEAKNDLIALADISISGELFQVPVPLSYKKLDPVRGDVVQRLRIVPPVSIKPFHTLFVFDKDIDQTTWARVDAFTDLNNVKVKVTYNNQELASVIIPKLAAGRDTLVPVVIPTHKIKGTDNNSFLLFSAVVDGSEFSKGRELVQYPHIPELQYFNEARIKVLRKDWDVRVKKVGYIEGAGDFVQPILNLCGVDVENIPVAAMSSREYLKNYEAIVVGVRAFNTKSEMGSWMPALLQYVAEGGTLIVQYNTSQGLLSTQLGPYPITLSRDRVTEEDATVTITDPASPLLTRPNKITQDDFKDWIQERGIYFPGSYAQEYKTMLAMHDTGEKDLQSAILYTPYGKGQFIYTSLVFFRELPAGNTGAIRLMMNMLSAGK